ncbi:MAG: hypothetical protein LBL86_07250 [Coriobacteriales bacterium]|jgi:hypothetical protein|nr:hypothetical protein [Coriobacteriales bacterium]
MDDRQGAARSPRWRIWVVRDEEGEDGAPRRRAHALEGGYDDLGEAARAARSTAMLTPVASVAVVEPAPGSPDGVAVYVAGPCGDGECRRPVPEWVAGVPGPGAAS